ncbi:outer membrane transport energization protein TonB [Undibacterium pigrum]|uniref:Outer membrane transport energization protein TonB n=2 Tax=Undibacterium pigrum TaxID=401470 RepID=A0A318J6Z4_9BURK|nr:outer membrane transport energization protein TonB [Undibacterium pigrum]
MLLIPASPNYGKTVAGLTPNLENNMEFTENQQHPLQRMSRLGVVAVLHVALLAALLSSMKITITSKKDGPIQISQIEKPVEKETIPPPEFETRLKNPITPPLIVPEPPTGLPTKKDESGLTNTEIGIKDTGKSVGTGTLDGTVVAAIAPPKNPIHVAAVINLNACDKPVYPASSIRNNEAGTVTLSMLIGTDGKVIETKTLDSSGYRALDRAASQALSLCRFTPGTIDGVAQQSWTKVQYVWKID